MKESGGSTYRLFMKVLDMYLFRRTPQRYTAPPPKSTQFITQFITNH